MRLFRASLHTVVWLTIIGCSSSVRAQTPTETGAEIHRLYLADQQDRGDGSQRYLPDEVNKRDELRRAQVRVLLAEGLIRTAQDFHDAAFIFQHGVEANDYLLAHILAVEAVVKGDASSKWISAATLDRYLQAIGQKQVFGTQYTDKKVVYYQQHKNDPAALSKPEARESGMTQQPYNDTLMPDALRLDFCVPNIEQQKKNLQEFEKGRYPEGIIPAGCTR